MFGNKIVVSKEQKELAVGIAKYEGSNESDISYDIIEFGIIFLIALSRERIKGERGGDISVMKAIETWKEDADRIGFSDAVVKFMNLENKKNYIGNMNWLATFTGIHTLNVAEEQKYTIQKSAQATKIPERTIGHCVFESGIAFMMLVGSSADEIKDTIRQWTYDEDIMVIAHNLRDAYDADMDDATPIEYGDEGY